MAQVVAHPSLTRIGASTHLIVQDKPMLLLAGEVHNSASSSLAHMENVFDRARELNCNALFVPVSWELIEPEESHYDFSLLDGLLEGARKRTLRLIPLWFGTFKNTWSSYVPGWVKLDQSRFPRQQASRGVNTGAVTVFCDEVRRCDALAFASMMHHLRKADAVHQTVVMVQVENEVGMLGASRDHCDLAEQAFTSHVPADLMLYLQEHANTLRPELGVPWQRAGREVSGCWSHVFGSAADEVFMAWHYARFVQTVAAAGQAEYALPMYANPWLVQYQGEEPGRYPSGGPVAHMIDVWRAAAPAIALLAPDIYVDDFKGVCADYTRSGNPLLIPEARRDKAMAAKALYAFGQHAAIAFSPFGIESVGLKGVPDIDGVVAAASLGNESSPHPAEVLAQTYQMIQDMMTDIVSCVSASRSVGILQTGNSAEIHELGGYRLQIEYSQPLDATRSPAGGIVLSPADGEFIVAGFGFAIRFLPPSGCSGNVDFLKLWEGAYHKGNWIPGRRLNGDEYHLRLAPSPSVRRATVYLLK